MAEKVTETRRTPNIVLVSIPCGNDQFAEFRADDHAHALSVDDLWRMREQITAALQRLDPKKYGDLR